MAELGAVIPLKYATMICNDAETYPLELVDVSERVLAQDVGKSAVSLATASEQGKWFVTVN
jgi:hypothetical protein